MPMDLPFKQIKMYYQRVCHGFNDKMQMLLPAPDMLLHQAYIENYVLTDFSSKPISVHQSGVS